MNATIAPDTIEPFERSLTWAGIHWWDIAVAIAVGLAIYTALGLLKQLLRALFDRAASASPFMGVLSGAVGRTSHLFMIVVAARVVALFFDPPSTLYGAINVLFIIVSAIQAAVWLRHVALGFIQLRSDPEAGGSEALANASGLIRVLVSIAIFAIATVVVLDNLGVNVTALVAGLGIGGIAIGLAAQGIFSDLFASLSIIFDKPFKVGDSINFGSQTGVVERIGLKSTRLRVVTGERMIVSNAQLLNKEITSFAGLDRRRLKFSIGVIYQTPPQVAERIPLMMKDIVIANGGTFLRSGFIGFGPSSLDFEVEFDVFSENWEEVYRIRHSIGLDILRRFNAEGIEFAYPTQTTFTAAPDGRMIMPYAALNQATSE